MKDQTKRYKKDTIGSSKWFVVILTLTYVWDENEYWFFDDCILSDFERSVNSDNNREKFGVLDM